MLQYKLTFDAKGCYKFSDADVLVCHKKSLACDEALPFYVSYYSAAGASSDPSAAAGAAGLGRLGLCAARRLSRRSRAAAS